MMGRAHHKSILSGRHCMLVAVEYGFCRGCRALEKCSVVDSKGFKRVAAMSPSYTHPLAYLWWHPSTPRWVDVEGGAREQPGGTPLHACRGPVRLPHEVPRAGEVLDS